MLYSNKDLLIKVLKNSPLTSKLLIFIKKTPELYKIYKYTAIIKNINV